MSGSVVKSSSTFCFMNNVFFNFKNWFLLYLKNFRSMQIRLYICENAYANFDNVCLFEKTLGITII